MFERRGQWLGLLLPIGISLLILGVLLALLWRERQLEQTRHQARLLSEVEAETQAVADYFALGFERATASVERYRMAIERRWQQPGALPPTPTLQKTVVRAADGAWRSLPERFDGQNDAGIWLPALTEPSALEWQLLAQANEVTTHYGLGARDSFFVDTWYMPDFGGISIFWPDEPAFIFQAAADYDYRPTEWVTLTTPENNPGRLARFTSLSFDPVARMWMVSVVAPVYAGERWRGAIGHDIPLARMLGDTSSLRRLAGARFVLVDSEQRLLASDRYSDLITEASAPLALSELPDPALAQALRTAPTGSDRWHVQVGGEQLFGARIGSHGVLLLAVPMTSFQAVATSVFSRLQWYVVLAFMLLSLVAGWPLWLSNRARLRQTASLTAAREELQDALTRSELMTRELAAISYGISHDLRAPLRHMSGYTQMLREQMLTRMNSEDLRLIHTIENSNRRAARMIEKLLVYLRVSQQEVQYKPVQLQAVIERALVESMALWPGAKVQWDVHAVVSLSADGQLLREAFLQLFDNALAAVANCREPQIAIRAQTVEDYVRISVRDNGHGFDPDKIDKIFEVFQKLEAATAEGPGVGLAIVRRVAERHGGRSWAETEPGQGSTFWLELPVRAGEETET